MDNTTMASKDLHTYSDKDCESMVTKCHDAILVIKDRFGINKERKSDTIQDALQVLSEHYELFRRSGMKRELSLRRRVAADMIENGVSRMVCRITKLGLSEGWLNEQGRIDQKSFKICYMALFLAYGHADASSDFAIDICKEDDWIERLIDYLLRFHSQYIVTGEPVHPLEWDFVHHGIGVLYNCSTVDENKRRLRELNVSRVFFPYMDVRVGDHRLLAVLGLAHLLTEEESRNLQEHTDGVKFLILRLNLALSDKNLRSFGWTARELANGIEKMANNEVNEELLVREGALAPLCQMMRLDHIEEQRASLGALLTLSFADCNKDKIISEPGLIQRLRDMQTDALDERVKRVAMRVLWNIREKLKDTEDYKKLGFALCHIETEKKSCTQRHVMISYSWAQQEIALKVRNELQRRGYRTWMDVHDMEGSTLQSMADAVEAADAILVCMSQQYKDSQFCRLEFEYAFKCKTMMIPLVMEPSYKPDGWLGFAIGNILYHNFSGKYSFASRLENLCKALGGHGRSEIGHSDAVDASQSQTLSQTTTTINTTEVTDMAKESKNEQISEWTQDHVRAWLCDIQLDQRSLLQQSDINDLRRIIAEKSTDRRFRPATLFTKTKLSALTGKDVAHLCEMYEKAPESFYRLLNSELQLNSVTDLTSFVYAIKELLR